MSKKDFGFSKKFSLKSLARKDVLRLDNLLSKAGYGPEDYRILEFENNSEIRIFNKTLFKEVRAIAGFMVRDLEVTERITKIRFIKQEESA